MNLGASMLTVIIFKKKNKTKEQEVRKRILTVEKKYSEFQGKRKEKKENKQENLVEKCFKEGFL